MVGGEEKFDIEGEIPKKTKDSKVQPPKSVHLDNILQQKKESQHLC